MKKLLALLALLAIAGCATNSGVDPKQVDDLQDVVNDAEATDTDVIDEGSSGGGGRW